MTYACGSVSSGTEAYQKGTKYFDCLQSLILVVIRIKLLGLTSGLLTELKLPELYLQPMTPHDHKTITTLLANDFVQVALFEDAFVLHAYG